MTTRRLGRVCHRPDISPFLGQLFYLPGRRVIVVPEARVATDLWRCGVVARLPDARQQPLHVAVSSADLGAGKTELSVDPKDTETYRLLWVAQVVTSLPNSLLAEAARHIVEMLWVPGSLRILAGDDGILRVCEAVGRRMRPETMRRVYIPELLRRRFLAPAGKGEVYTLTLP